MSKLNFILELTQPNRLLCGVTWKGRSLIRGVCAGVYALRFTYHAAPALDLPLPDLETTLNSIVWGLTHSRPHSGMCMYTHRGLKNSNLLPLSDRIRSPLDFKAMLAIVLSMAKAGKLFLYLNSWRTSHRRANKATSLCAGTMLAGQPAGDVCVPRQRTLQHLGQIPPKPGALANQSRLQMEAPRSTE